MARHAQTEPVVDKDLEKRKRQNFIFCLLITSAVAVLCGVTSVVLSGNENFKVFFIGMTLLMAFLDLCMFIAWDEIRGINKRAEADILRRQNQQQ